MKRYFQYIALACLAFALNSCIKDEFASNSFCRDSQLTLNLSLGDLTRTDNPDNGIGEGTNDDGVVGYTKIPLNENKITRVEIYLYPTGSESSDAKFAYAQDITANDKVEKLKCTVPAGALNDLFGSSGTPCSAYVVVNYKNETVFDTDNDNAVTTLTGTSIKTLKKRVVETTFNGTESITMDKFGASLMCVSPQESFVMDSDIATITKTDNALSGTVYVTRAAAKISFQASIPDNLTIDGITWTPDLENMTIAFKNIAKNSYIDNGSDTADTTDDLGAISTAAYQGISGVQLYYTEAGAQAPGFEGDSVEGVDTWSVANIVVPFYTYSNFWTEKADNEPAITLSVPWFQASDRSATYTTYTYTVPFNIDATTKQGKFVRNKHYQYNLRVGVLGDLVELGTSEFSYVVLDWIGKNTINVELQKPTYLVVEKDYVEVFNENSYSVNYSSSDDIDVEIVSIIKPDYSAEVPKEYRYIYGDKDSDSGLATVPGSGFSGNTADFKVVVDEENNKITLSHTLVNKMEDDKFDYVPYTVKVKVTMKAGTKTYVEYITFKQYPAIHIYADTNAAFDQMYTTESTFNKNNNDPDNTFVNGRSRSSNQAPGVENSPSSCGDVYGLNYGSNKNPNQYVITISSLGDSGLPYIIADSRSRTSDVEGLGIGTIASSFAVDYDFKQEAGKRQLKYYYRTIEDHKTGESSTTDPGAYVTGYNIAPKYRIASSYSVTSNTNGKDVARKRCATYQENGYPAGRWRMPTYAEVAFIASMSDRLMIPRLFTDDRPYWCAHGEFKPNGSKVDLTGGNDAYSIRCVYDEWYWGSKRLSTDTTNDTPNYAQFVWGDMQIW